MPYEPDLASCNPKTAEVAAEMIETCKFDDLPDDFAELAAQLEADADRLAALYPPSRRFEADQLSALAAPLARPANWLPRVAAAIAALGGLTLAVSAPSLWKAAPLWLGAAQVSTGEPQGPAAPLGVPEGLSSDGSSSLHTANNAVGTAPSGDAREPEIIPISTEDMQQIPGEQVEILADAVNGQRADI
jgi:hypothetical protein